MPCDVPQKLMRSECIECEQCGECERLSGERERRDEDECEILGERERCGRGECE